MRNIYKIVSLAMDVIGRFAAEFQSLKYYMQIPTPYFKCRIEACTIDI